MAPFGKSGVRRLASRATGSDDLSEARVGWLLRASEGDPSLIESLLVEGAWEKGGSPRRSERNERSVDSILGRLSSHAISFMES